MDGDIFSLTINIFSSYNVVVRKVLKTPLAILLFLSFYQVPLYCCGECDEFYVDIYDENECQTDPLNYIFDHNEYLGLCDSMEITSEVLLGNPYVLGALGEGEEGEFDQDPLYRIDAFDCTSFVETVLALSGATSEEEFLERMNQIRYSDGVIDYVHRNHFTSLDWLPHLIEQGFVKDITSTIVAPEDVRLAVTVIDKKSWYELKRGSDLRIYSEQLGPLETKEKTEEFQLLGSDILPEQATIPYIPFEKVVGQGDFGPLSKIPTGTILSIVRPNWNIKAKAGTNINVSHQGIVIQKEDGAYFRHASYTQKEVVEVPLEEYLKTYLGSSSAKGINLLEPL
jgi:hypothetical protein